MGVGKSVEVTGYRTQYSSSRHVILLLEDKVVTEMKCYAVNDYKLHLYEKLRLDINSCSWEESDYYTSVGLYLGVCFDEGIQRIDDSDLK